MPEMTRRSVLAGFGALVAAPAIGVAKEERPIFLEDFGAVANYYSPANIAELNRWAVWDGAFLGHSWQGAE
jgi:hypothetical protein